MFYLFSALRDARRRPWKSLLAVLIALALTAFFLIYAQMMAAVEGQLARLADTVPVTAEVTNLNGSQTVGLQIPGDKLEGLLACPFVKEPVYTAQNPAYLAPEREKALYDVKITGINNFSAFPLLDTASFSFAPGYDLKDFWAGADVCLAQEDFLRLKHLAVGDTVELVLYNLGYQEDDPTIGDPQKLCVTSLRIIGSFRGTGGDLATYPDLLTPIAWNAGLYAGTDFAFTADSFHFTVADPLALNEFKAQMQQLGMRNVNLHQPFDRLGRALTVNDKLFIQTAGQLLSSRMLYRTAVPLLAAVAVLIGFVASTLLVQSRRREFLTMRSLGAKKSQCLTTFFVEFAVLCLAGCLAGALGALFLKDLSAAAVLAVCLAVFVCYMTGTAITTLLLGRLNMMEALKQKD